MLWTEGIPRGQRYLCAHAAARALAETTQKRLDSVSMRCSIGEPERRLSSSSCVLQAGDYEYRVTHDGVAILEVSRSTRVTDRAVQST